jgi:hypothetical protein
MPPGSLQVTVSVSDGRGGTATTSIFVELMESLAAAAPPDPAAGGPRQPVFPSASGGEPSVGVRPPSTASPGPEPPVVSVPVFGPAPGAASTWGEQIFQYALFILGAVLVLVIVRAAMRVPHPSVFQHSVFRAALALGAGCVVASAPWFIGTPTGVGGTAGVAGGALGVFLLVYLYDPIGRLGNPESNSGAVNVGDGSKPFVFVSYRRGDDLDVVIGRLRERLVKEFGEHAVFRDKDTITLGLDFRKELEDALQHCRVLIAVIGPQWEQLRTERNIRKLDERDDFVTLEISSVLSRGLPVIPVLVKRTEFPDATALPERLFGLQDRQRLVLRLDDPDFTNDVTHLIDDIKVLLSALPALNTSIRPIVSRRASGRGAI